MNPMCVDSMCTKLCGRQLECRHEEKNEEDEFAIGVYRNDFQKETLVGHMPRNISKFVYKFLKLSNSKLSCKVKGKRLNRGAGYDLEIPVIYMFNGHKKPSSG